jgi:hypothetical protein
MKVSNQTTPVITSLRIPSEIFTNSMSPGRLNPSATGTLSAIRKTKLTRKMVDNAVDNAVELGAVAVRDDLISRYATLRT